MEKIKPTVYQSGDGERWIKFGEFFEVVAKKRDAEITLQDLWKFLRIKWTCHGGLVYTTAGLMRFNADFRSPESIHADLKAVFIEEKVADEFLLE